MCGIAVAVGWPEAEKAVRALLAGMSHRGDVTDPSVSPNLASSYLIEQSSDGTNFTQVTTAPSGTTSIAIGGLSASTQYYFRIRGANSIGIDFWAFYWACDFWNIVCLSNSSAGFLGKSAVSGCY